MTPVVHCSGCLRDIPEGEMFCADCAERVSRKFCAPPPEPLSPVKLRLSLWLVSEPGRYFDRHHRGSLVKVELLDLGERIAISPQYTDEESATQAALDLADGADELGAASA